MPPTHASNVDNVRDEYNRLVTIIHTGNDDASVLRAKEMLRVVRFVAKLIKHQESPSECLFSFYDKDELTTLLRRLLPHCIAIESLYYNADLVAINTLETTYPPSYPPCKSTNHLWLRRPGDADTTMLLLGEYLWQENCCGEHCIYDEKILYTIITRAMRAPLGHNGPAELPLKTRLMADKYYVLDKAQLIAWLPLPDTNPSTRPAEF